MDTYRATLVNDETGGLVTIGCGADSDAAANAYFWASTPDTGWHIVGITKVAR